MRGGPRIPIPDSKLQVIAAIRKLLILAVVPSERVAHEVAMFGISNKPACASELRACSAI
jgi:hypothetical protein